MSAGIPLLSSTVFPSHGGDRRFKLLLQCTKAFRTKRKQYSSRSEARCLLVVYQDEYLAELKKVKDQIVS